MPTLRDIFEDDYHSFGKRAAKLIESIEAVGVRVPPGSRFRCYVSEMDRIVEKAVWRRSIDRNIFHQANLELEDLEFILGTGAASNVASFKGHLEQIVSGNVAPQDEHKHSRARDLQFELLIAATLQSNGAPVRMEEPDVVFELEGTTYGVAAKRPRSLQKLGKNLRAAEKQISPAGLQGLIALDLSCLLNPENAFLQVNKFSEAGEYVSNWLDAFVRANRERFIADTQPSAALGLFVYVAIMAVDLSRPRLGTVRHSVFLPFHCTCGNTPLKRIFSLLSRSSAMAKSN